MAVEILRGLSCGEIFSLNVGNAYAIRRSPFFLFGMVRNQQSFNICVPMLLSALQRAKEFIRKDLGVLFYNGSGSV